jgi:hypothetical protein
VKGSRAHGRFPLEAAPRLRSKVVFRRKRKKIIKRKKKKEFLVKFPISRVLVCVCPQGSRLNFPRNGRRKAVSALLLDRKTVFFVFLRIKSVKT